MSQFYDQASLVMVPSGYKAGKVYSQKPLSTDGELTFTRNSNATRVNADGLVEKVRTNLIKYSNDFSNAVYLKSNTTVTAGQSDPNGGTNASKIVFASGFNSFLYQIVGAGTKTNSVWLRADSPVEIGFHNGQSSNAVTLTTSWVRYSVTQLGTSSAGFQLDNYFGVSTPQLAVTFYAYQAQNEESDFGPTPYIPTTSAAVSVGPTANVPRLNYSNGCPSLLLEPQRTNVVPYSEQLSQWGLAFATLTSNDAISPDGYQNADKIVTTNAGCDVKYTNVSVSPSTTYTASFWVKLTSGNGLQGRFYDNTNGANIEYYGYDSQLTIGEWSRVTRTFTTPAGCTNIQVWYLAASSSSSVTAHFWGYQLEAGSYATSYIPTLGASVTRLADAASKTGISSLIGQTEGTIFVEIEKYADGYWYFTLSDGVSNWIFIGEDLGKLRGYVRTSSAGVQTDNRTADLTVGTHKMAIAYKLNDVAIYLDGAQVFTDNAADMPTTLNRLGFSGASISAGADQTIKGAINQALLFKTRLSNADLETLTTP